MDQARFSDFMGLLKAQFNRRERPIFSHSYRMAVSAAKLAGYEVPGQQKARSLLAAISEADCRKATAWHLAAINAPGLRLDVKLSDSGSFDIYAAKTPASVDMAVEKRSSLNWEAITMSGLAASDIHLEAANIVRELRQENLRHGGCDHALGAVLCGYLGVMAGSIPFTKAVSK